MGQKAHMLIRCTSRSTKEALLQGSSMAEKRLPSWEIEGLTGVMEVQMIIWKAQVKSLLVFYVAMII